MLNQDIVQQLIDNNNIKTFIVDDETKRVFIDLGWTDGPWSFDYLNGLYVGTKDKCIETFVDHICEL